MPHSQVQATFWKADKFHPEPVWEEHRLRALVVELVPLRKGGKRLVVANMALESHANRPHDRVLQTRGLLSAIARRVEQQGGRRPDYQGTPLLLCGSMGGDATSGAYTLVTKGVLEEGATEMSSPGVVLTERELSHPFKLQDAYSTAGSEVRHRYPGMFQDAFSTAGSEARRRIP